MKPNIFYTHSFNEIYPTYDVFSTDYATYSAYVPSGDRIDTNVYLPMLYNLIQAKHGYDRVATKPFVGFTATYEQMLLASDTQFKREFFAIVNTYGALWQKKHDIQLKLRGLTDDEVFAGARQVINTANNPSTDPTTTDTGELQYIDGQTTTNYVKSKMEGYNILWESLRSNPTDDFLRKFDKLFKVVVNPWYNYSGYDEEE